MSEEENISTAEKKSDKTFGIPTVGWIVIYVASIIVFTYFFDSFITEWKMTTGRIK